MSQNKKPLSDIPSPEALQKMTAGELHDLAEAIRERIVTVVSQNGGHLASNLGVIELTIALHRVFDFTTDRLLWDVGHQCYPHKLLTGRAETFDSLRQADGLSGFPNPEESEYDLFKTGHAGTAISTAAGLAWADQKLGRKNNVVAVVGDASIVNGLSLEGLNNAAMLKRQFLIVLNDNSMAIDRTQGAMADALDRVRMTHRYIDLKTHTEQLLKKMPLGGSISDMLKHIKDGLKTTLHGPKVFETLGFGYFGPVDGHDLPTLIRVLDHIKDLAYPVVLHVHTEKGRGRAYAVEDPTLFHSPSAFKMQDETPVFTKSDRQTWTQVFAEALIDAAKADENVVAITAAMPDGTGLATFRNVFPNRTLDVGISESHAVAAAAGMAKSGVKPVVAVYSTFMQRAFDQAFHELSLQHLPVVLCMDRAGLVGSDGAVHHGFGDIAFLRLIPGMTLLAPADAPEMAAALNFALTCDGPTGIRYPRDLVPEPLDEKCPPFELGKSRTVRKGKDGTIFAYGPMVALALPAAELLAEDHMDVAVINARFAKPLDTDALKKALAKGKPLLTVEDHAVTGGLGSAVLEWAAASRQKKASIRCLGIPDEFIHHASRTQQLEECGLTPVAIAEAFKVMV